MNGGDFQNQFTIPGHGLVLATSFPSSSITSTNAYLIFSLHLHDVEIYWTKLSVSTTNIKMDD